MNHKKYSLASLAAKIGFFVVIGAGAVALSAFAWTGPTATPPAGNVSAPINVSSSTQTKFGNLVLNGLSVNAATILSGVLQIPIGTPAAGEVLTSADASGTVEWAQPSSVASSSYIVTPYWSDNVVCPNPGAYDNIGSNGTGAANDLQWLCNSSGYATAVANGSYTPTSTGNPMTCTNGNWTFNSNTNGNFNFYCASTTGNVIAICSSNYTCSPSSTTVYSATQGIYCNWNGDYDLTGQGVSSDTHIQCESNHVFSMNQGNQVDPTYVQEYKLSPTS